MGNVSYFHPTPGLCAKKIHKHKGKTISLSTVNVKAAALGEGKGGFAIAVFLMIVAIGRHAHVCYLTSRNVTGHDII